MADILKFTKLGPCKFNVDQNQIYFRSQKVSLKVDVVLSTGVINRGLCMGADGSLKLSSLDSKKDILAQHSLLHFSWNIWDYNIGVQYFFF
jgi:hypothetical protein